MRGMGETPDEDCPFEFNFDAQSFKVGDIVSYRVPERFDDMAFVGELTEVGDDYVIINANDPEDPQRRMRGTREDRPAVTAKEALE